MEGIRAILTHVVERVQNDYEIEARVTKRYPLVIKSETEDDFYTNTKALIKFSVVSWIQRIIQPYIILQLNDGRAAIIREACQLIKWISQEYPEEFSEMQSQRAALLGGGNGVQYLRADALPKLASSSNKVLQELGHQNIRHILERCPPFDDIAVHLAPFTSSRMV